MQNYIKLRQELIKRGLSINKLANAAGIVPQNLYAAVNGKSEFWPGWQKRVADALNCEVSDLFEGENGND